MLNAVQLIDFCNHRKTRLTLGRMTALVGQNGSGKTSVMRALEVLGTPVNDPSIAVAKQWHGRHGGNGTILRASWDRQLDGGFVEYGLYIGKRRQWFSRQPEPNESPGKWLPDAPDEESHRRKHTRSIEIFQTVSEAHKSREGLVIEHDTIPIRWKCRYFKTNGSILHTPSYSETPVPSLGADGSNLASTLAYLMTAEPKRFAAIIRALRIVVPIVKRVRARPALIARTEKKTITINRKEHGFDEEQQVMGQELLFDMASGTGLPASAVSEGTLVTLALLTLVYGADEADMIMLDDVELGLHPKAQRDLMKQLRLLQESHPKLQLLVSTHSPYVVDELKPEEVWLFAPDAEGCAISKRMSDHPDAKRSLEVLTTGEFWSAEGEQWVLGGTKPGHDKSRARKRA